MTDRFCVFGNPVGHSLSPQIHQCFAEQFGHRLDYYKQLASIPGFKRCVARQFRLGLRGANVTAPFKQQAFELATRLTPQAKSAGAVNTLVKDRAGGLLGANTDGSGLIRDLQRLQIPLSGQRILLIGAGGAARGVLANLLNAPIDVLWIYNRTASKAQALADLNDKARAVTRWSDVNGIDVIINASSASLSGQLPSVPERLFSEASAVYDMMYGAGPTPFLQHARLIGSAQCFDGLGMLVGQAAESYRLWWQCELPKMAPVIAKIRQQLASH
ncbi:shikimate dehydrogenase [Idiomarina seosinensis]|uniref:shikimate dehydrogenase n=1 Tax=Idiomarina seosinensis TaxID=281739 RepID=UPI00384F0614